MGNHPHYFGQEGHCLESTNLTIAEEGAFDERNPQSLLNLLPTSIQEHLLKTKNHFLNDLSPESIRKNIQHTPEYKLARHVRAAFWKEYDNALAAGRKMQMTRIHQGVTANSGEFYNLFKKEHLAVFIFTKPIQKEVREASLLDLAYEQIEEILSASHIKKDGTMDPFAAKVKVEIFKHLEERVNGGIVKHVAVRSEVKNTNINVDATPANLIEMKRAEELQSRLIDLREKTKDIEAIAYNLEEEDE
jgi:hypothetical protein